MTTRQVTRDIATPLQSSRSTDRRNRNRSHQLSGEKRFGGPDPHLQCGAGIRLSMQALPSTCNKLTDVLLSLSGIQKHFGGVKALRDGNLVVEEGEVHLLM